MQTLLVRREFRLFPGENSIKRDELEFRVAIVEKCKERGADFGRFEKGLWVDEFGKEGEEGETIFASPLGREEG
jgi:hypothetical protein